MDIGEFWPSVEEIWREAGSPNTPRALFKLSSGMLVRLEALVAKDTGPLATSVVWDSVPARGILDSRAALVSGLPGWLAIAHVRALLAENRLAEAAIERALLRQCELDDDERPDCWLAHVAAGQLGIEAFEGGPTRLQPPGSLLSANRRTLAGVRAACTSSTDVFAAIHVIGRWLGGLASIVELGLDPYDLSHTLVSFAYDGYEICAQSLVEWCAFLELPELEQKLGPVADLSFLDSPPSGWELGMGLAQAEAGGELDVAAGLRMRVLQQLRGFPLAGEAFSKRVKVIEHGERVSGSRFGPLTSWEVVTPPKEADEFLRLVLRTRLELGQVEEALSDLPPGLAESWELEQNLPAQLAYLAGQVVGAVEERRRLGEASPNGILTSEEFGERAKRTEAMVRFGSATSMAVAQEIRGMRVELGAVGELVLDAQQDRAQLAAQAEEDRRHHELREEMLRAWERVVSDGEIARTEQEAREFVGKTAWGWMTTDAQREVLSYAAAARNWKDRFAYQSGRSLGYAFEGEVKAALMRSGIAGRDVERRNLGQVVDLAYQSNDAALSEIGRVARNQDPSIVRLRDNAAHPGGREFTPDDLKQMAWRLFAKGDAEKGLLARVVMCCRAEAPANAPE